MSNVTSAAAAFAAFATTAFGGTALLRTGLDAIAAAALGAEVFLAMVFAGVFFLLAMGAILMIRGYDGWRMPREPAGCGPLVPSGGSHAPRACIKSIGHEQGSASIY